MTLSAHAVRSLTGTTCAASAGHAPPGTAGRPTGNAAPPDVRPLPAGQIATRTDLKVAAPAADLAVATSPPQLTSSIRYAGLRGWHALLCVLFGFYLASTPLAPYIRTGCNALARFIAGVGF